MSIEAGCISLQIRGVDPVWAGTSIAARARDPLRSINANLALSCADYSATIVREFHSVRDLNGAVNEIAALLELISLRLVAPVSPVSDGADVSPYPGAGFNGLPEHWPWDRNSLFDWPGIDESDLTDLGDRLPAWAQRSRYFDSAIDRYERALFADSYPLAVAWAVASMEALVRPRDIDGSEAAGDEDPIAKAVAWRIAALISTQPARRQSVRRWIINCYQSIRSAEFHTAASVVTDATLDRLRKAFARKNPSVLAHELLRETAHAIMNFQERTSQGDSVEEVLQALRKDSR